MKRRDFLRHSAGLIGTCIPVLASGQSRPCSPPTVNVSGGQTVTTSRDPATPPAYIADIPPYTLRALSGAYAPSNGLTTIQSVTPDEWLRGDPGTSDVSGVILAWCGGGKSRSPKLVISGGGHNNSANNGLYQFDLNGSNAPNGWQKTVISPVSAIINQSCTYSDGKPTSIHTYDGLVYADHNSTFYRFGGAWYSTSGGFCACTAKYDGSSWTSLKAFPGGSGGLLTFYDANARKIFVFREESNTGYFFRCDDDSWSSAKSFSNQVSGFYSIAAWASSRGQGMVIGGGDCIRWTIDFSAETVSNSRLSPSGATSIVSSQAPGVVYDDWLDVYWIFGGVGVNTGLTNIWYMNPNTAALTSVPVSGGPIPVLSEYYGMYSRFAFMSDWRAIATLASHTSPVYILRLPSSLS